MVEISLTCLSEFWKMKYTYWKSRWVGEDRTRNGPGHGEIETLIGNQTVTAINDLEISLCDIYPGYSLNQNFKSLFNTLVFYFVFFSVIFATLFSPAYASLCFVFTFQLTSFVAFCVNSNLYFSVHL